MPNLGAMFFGRLNRSHYAVLTIAYLAITRFVTPLVFSVLGPLAWIVNLILLIVISGIIVRRLHDFSQSGNWIFVAWLPMIFGNVGNYQLAGWALLATQIAQLVIIFLPGSSGGNRYGPPQPKWQSWRTSILGA